MFTNRKRKKISLLLCLWRVRSCSYVSPGVMENSKLCSFWKENVCLLVDFKKMFLLWEMRDKINWLRKIDCGELVCWIIYLTWVQVFEITKLLQLRRLKQKLTRCSISAKWVILQWPNKKRSWRSHQFWDFCECQKRIWHIQRLWIFAQTKSK